MTRFLVSVVHGARRLRAEQTGNEPRSSTGDKLSSRCLLNILVVMARRQRQLVHKCWVTLSFDLLI